MSSDAQLLSTGTVGFDRLLGGGIPTRQVLLLAGYPGSGKTIIASQIAFAQAARGAPVLLATAASEPHTKMLESLQGFSFFKRERIGREIFLLSAYPWLRKGAKEAREMLLSSVREHRARLLVLDGLRSLADVWRDEAATREFLAELGVGLATHDCTGVLTFECAPHRVLETPEAATVDGVVSLFFEREAMRRTRHLEVVKIRGRRPIPGEHAAALGPDGFLVTPRLEVDPLPEVPAPKEGKTPFGIPSLDSFLGGGLPSGGLTLLSGEGGSGKSLLAWAFARGAGAPALFASLEEGEAGLRARTARVGLEARSIEVWSPSRVGLDADAVARELVARCRASSAQRVVVDGVDLLLDSVRPERRGDFLLAFERALRAGVPEVLLTAPADAASLRQLARAADNVFALQRDQGARKLTVDKLRAGPMPRGGWAFDLGAHGAVTP